MDFNTLIDNGTLNQCNFVEVIQIILLCKKDGSCWNYFTHLLFSSIYTEQKEREYVTTPPQSINSEYKIIITKDIIPKEDALNVLQNAAEKQKWEWKEDVVLLDDVFPINPQFIPNVMMLGSKALPIEA